MLYNPRWKLNKKKLFSLDGLVEWLERQDPRTKYDYNEAESCLIARYLLAHGWSDYHIPDLRKAGLADFAEVANAATKKEWTYGAALKRARELQRR